jgi:hypothetical protein
MLATVHDAPVHGSVHGPTLRPFTLVLRLLPEPGAGGRIVGHAEVVSTNEVIALTGAADLISLVKRLSAADP